MAEKRTKTCSPVDRWIKPYPFAPLNHFTVPFSLTKVLLSLLLIDLPAFFARPAPQNPPSKNLDNLHQVTSCYHEVCPKKSKALNLAEESSAGGPVATPIARVATTRHNTSA